MQKHPLWAHSQWSIVGHGFHEQVFAWWTKPKHRWSSFYLILQTKTSLQVHLLMIWSGLLLQTSRTRSLECLVTPRFLQLWRSTTGALILFPHHVANLRLSKLHLASSSLTWSMYQTKLVQSNKIQKKTNHPLNCEYNFQAVNTKHSVFWRYELYSEFSEYSPPRSDSCYFLGQFSGYTSVKPGSIHYVYMKDWT